jgi:hypothetical protein
MSRRRGSPEPWWTYVKGNHEPIWSDDFDYKPAPKAREWWLGVRELQPELVSRHETRKDALAWAGPGLSEIIHVREVLP